MHNSEDQSNEFLFDDKCALTDCEPVCIPEQRWQTTNINFTVDASDNLKAHETSLGDIYHHRYMRIKCVYNENQSWTCIQHQRNKCSHTQLKCHMNLDLHASNVT